MRTDLSLLRVDIDEFEISTDLHRDIMIVRPANYP